jgi:hypothetical protein
VRFIWKIKKLGKLAKIFRTMSIPRIAVRHDDATVIRRTSAAKTAQLS